MAIPEASQRVEEGRKLPKADTSSEAEASYKDILSRGPGSTDNTTRDFENALMGLGELYRDQRRPDDLAQLVQSTREELSNLPKAKTAKIGMRVISFSLKPHYC